MILEIPRGIEINVSDLRETFYLSRQRFIVCLPDITIPEVNELKEISIPFYWGYAISTPIDLRSAKKIGVCCARIGAPLFFQTDILKEYGVPVRSMVNLANDNYFFDRDAITGTWIRPEDLSLYEGIIESVDFHFDTLEQERALFRIYTQRKEWPGDLDMIIRGMPSASVNRMLPSELTKRRMNCGQKCMNTCNTSGCHLCDLYVKLAVPDRLKQVLPKNKDN